MKRIYIRGFFNHQPIKLQFPYIIDFYTNWNACNIYLPFDAEKFGILNDISKLDENNTFK